MADPINRDLREWTRGERLWIWRKERGLTQAEAARSQGIPRNEWQVKERDKTPAAVRRSMTRSTALAYILPLARRRSGLGLDEVADKLRTTRVTVHHWERTGDARLVRFWTKQGFTF